MYGKRRTDGSVGGGAPRCCSMRLRRKNGFWTARSAYARALAASRRCNATPTAAEKRFCSSSKRLAASSSLSQLVNEGKSSDGKNAGKPLMRSRVHVMGVAYKRDIDDLRESPALDVMLLLKRRGAVLSYSDPFVPEVKLEGLELKASPQECAATADCVVIVTDHSAFDYRTLVEQSALIVDSRNALKEFRSEKVVRL